MNRYFEAKRGNIPLLITVPHGGALVPQNIPNRDFGSYKKDRDTVLVLKEIIAHFSQKKQKPYYVCMNLHRRKIDVNRGSREGAQNAEMLKVYKEYHNQIREMRLEIQKKFGGGLLIDLHGQKAKRGIIEIGYGLNKEQLTELKDIPEDLVYKKSSIRHLIKSGFHAHDVVFGPKSLGTLFSKSYKTYPSEKNQQIEEAHFNGVYTLQRHVIKRGNEKMVGANLELCFEGIRNTESNRRNFAKKFVVVVNSFLKEYFLKGIL